VNRTSRRRVALIVTIALAALVGFQTPASAAARWTFVPTAAGAAYGHLAGVACPTSSTCFAVGWYDGPPAGKMIQRWNGKKWTIAAAPNPSGVVSSSLSGVSCVSTVSCVAVGQYNTQTATKTMVVRWDGHTWTLQTGANVPTSPVNGLAGVKCMTSTNCFAVGTSYAATWASSAQSTLIEHWDGATWAIVPSPNQAGANNSTLAAVACVNNGNCYAVGSYDTNTLTNTLIEHWNGASWNVVPSPNPPTSRFTDLSGITCTTNAVCIAVGSADGSLVEQLSGTTWSIVGSPNPKGASAVSLTGISCTSASQCVAVGDQLQTHVFQRVVEMWNGKRWAIVNVPVPSGTKKSDLSGVSCSPTMKCFAVGDYRVGTSRRPLLERYA
jgi:hypothetical protein